MIDECDIGYIPCSETTSQVSKYLVWPVKVVVGVGVGHSGRTEEAGLQGEPKARSTMEEPLHPKRGENEEIDIDHEVKILYTTPLKSNICALWRKKGRIGK